MSREQEIATAATPFHSLLYRYHSITSKQASHHLMNGNHPTQPQGSQRYMAYLTPDGPPKVLAPFFQVLEHVHRTPQLPETQSASADHPFGFHISKVHTFYLSIHHLGPAIYHGHILRTALRTHTSKRIFGLQLCEARRETFRGLKEIADELEI